MKANFRIISFTEIEINGIELELHNNFDFLADKIEVSERQIKLHFKKSEEAWAIHTPVNNLCFILEDYNFLKQIEPGPEWPDDDFCLAGITFFDSDFREVDDHLMERQSPNEDDDIIFSFESGRIIRVNCDSVTLETGS